MSIANNSDPIIENCTVIDCRSPVGGALYIGLNSNPQIKNSVFVSCKQSIWFNPNTNATVNNCDFYRNPGSNFHGAIPIGLGEISTVNANGDSCDMFYNIFLDPEFVNPNIYNLNLLATSPCIDAGDPGSPLDPDWTIADIGAYHYDQGNPCPIELTLTPYNPPIQIPPGGGQFEFNIEVANIGVQPYTFDVWTVIVKPNTDVYGPIINRNDIVLTSGGSASRDLIQVVPGYAPSGDYIYKAFTGYYPFVVWSEEEFGFEKLAGGE